MNHLPHYMVSQHRKPKPKSSPLWKPHTVLLNRASWRLPFNIICIFVSPISYSFVLCVSIPSLSFTLSHSVPHSFIISLFIFPSPFLLTPYFHLFFISPFLRFIYLLTYVYIYTTTSFSFRVFHVSFLSSCPSIYVICNYTFTRGLLLQICPSQIQPWYAACVSHTFYHPYSNV